MKSQPVARYQSKLREQQKADTRSLILETMERLLKDRALEAVSIADIADAAGVTERTVYRHFESREALLAATWEMVHDSVGIHVFPRTAAELIDLPLRVFPAFDERAEVILAMLASPQGRELRLRVNEERQAAMREAVRDARPNLRGPALTRLCAAVQLLYSASGWATMRDYWNLSGEQSGRAASEAIAALLSMRVPTSARTRRSNGGA